MHVGKKRIKRKITIMDHLACTYAARK